MGALIALRTAGIDKNLLIELNDSGYMFNEIDDYMDRINEQALSPTVDVSNLSFVLEQQESNGRVFPELEI